MFVRWFGRLEPMLDEDGRGGSGGGSPADGFSRLLERHGGSYEAVARTLYEDNYDYRRVNRDLKTENESLRGKVPAEGTVILNDDEAHRWQAYQALDLTPDAITARLKEGDEAKTQRDGLVKDQSLRDVAATAGYDFDVLKDKGGALDYEIREVAADGKQTKQAFVKDGATTVALHEYAQQHWPKYLPALTQNSQPRPTGTVFVPQTSGGGDAPDPIAAAIKAQQEARDARGPNPLKPTT